MAYQCGAVLLQAYFTRFPPHKKMIYKLILNIPKFNHDYSYKELSRLLNIPTINERRIYLSMNIGHNILVQGAFDKQLTLPFRIPAYNSRLRDLFMIPRCRLNATKNSFRTI